MSPSNWDGLSYIAMLNLMLEERLPC